MTRSDVRLIHPTAIISAEAILAPDVRVGPFAVIDGPVQIGPGSHIRAHVHLMGPMTIGADNDIGTGCILGDRPQHLAYKGEDTRVEIGDGNTFREHVTVHRGMPDSRGVTRIGDGNYFMVNSHVAHDCILGNRGMFVNGCLIGGHAEIADRAMLSGNSTVHQNCRVGKLALLGACSSCTVDVPPFWIVRELNTVRGVNVIGMKRAGYSPEEIVAVRKAFKMLYLQRMTISLAVARMEQDLGHSPAVVELVDFIRKSKRGIPGAKHYAGAADAGPTANAA